MSDYPLWKGSNFATLSEEWNFNPTEGTIVTMTYSGHRDPISGVFNSSIAQGFEAQLWHDGPLYFCRVRKPHLVPIPGVENTQVTWTLATEIVEKSIWSHPRVKVLEAAWDADPPAHEVWKGTLKKVLSKMVDSDDYTGKEITDQITVWSGQYGADLALVFFELTAGVENWPADATVARKQTVGYSGYPFNRDIYAVQNVYTETQIGLPNVMWKDIGIPPAEHDTILGWRIRTQEYNDDGAKSTETLEWVYGRHSSLLYYDATA